MPDQGQVGGRLLAVEIEASLHRHGHVGLSGSEPHLAHQHVPRLGLAAALADRHERPRFGAGRHGVEPDAPPPLGVGHGLFVLTAEGDVDLLLRIAESPDGDGLVALKNHVIGDRGGEPEVGGKKRGRPDEYGKKNLLQHWHGRGSTMVMVSKE